MSAVLIAKAGRWLAACVLLLAGAAGFALWQLQLEFRAASIRSPAARWLLPTLRVAIIGLDNTGNSDRHFTPYSRVVPFVKAEADQMPGAEIHANIVETILAGRYPRSLALPWEIAYVALIVALAAWLFIKLRAGVGAAVGILSTLVFPPKAATADAGTAIDGLADSVSDLLVRAADEMLRVQRDDGDVAAAARAWLGEARAITHEIPSRSMRRETSATPSPVRSRAGSKPSNASR